MPKWVTESNPALNAVFLGLSHMLTKAQENIEDHIKQSFFSTSSERHLDLHGADRGKNKLSGETEESYRARIQEIKNNSSFPDITRIMSNILKSGVEVIEIQNHGVFCDSGNFLDTNALLPLRYDRNFFSMIIKEDAVRDKDYYSRLIEIIDQEKALGVDVNILFKKYEFALDEFEDLDLSIN